jgi:hypothetical protein
LESGQIWLHYGTNLLPIGKNIILRTVEEKGFGRFLGVAELRYEFKVSGVL